MKGAPVRLPGKYQVGDFIAITHPAPLIALDLAKKQLQDQIDRIGGVTDVKWFEKHGYPMTNPETGKTTIVDLVAWKGFTTCPPKKKI